jgi:adenylate cyclase
MGFPVEPAEISAPMPTGKAHFLSFGGDARNWLLRNGGGVGNLPLLVNAANGNGAVSLVPDSDGIVRAMPLLYRVRDTLYPILGLEAMRVFLGSDNLSLWSSAPDASRLGKAVGIQGIGLDTAFVPTTPDGRVWLHYRHFKQDRYVSAQDLLAGKVDSALIKNHIVFIGATAKGLGDTVYSPLGEAIPGVEGHVQLVEQLMTGDFLLRAAWENDLLTGALLTEWLLLSLMLARYRPAWSVLVSSLMLAGVFILSYWLFVNRRLLLDPFYPALALSTLFLAMVVPSYLRTEREQRWIRNAFSRYVSPNRVKYLQEHPQHLELGGDYRECSFVMSDLQGFTPLMEKYEPALLSSLLNDYLDGMIQIAFHHDGTIDRIVGDAVAVMFSAPLVQPDHAARALACALEMDCFAMAFSRIKQEQGIPFGWTRIGVNTGVVMVGNFGGKSMLDYRALGDAINTAARLETINAQLGTRICISGATVAQCPSFVGRPVGWLILKGKSKAIAAFEPQTMVEAAEDRSTEYLAAYALMEAESTDAVDAFLRLAEKFPDDPLAKYHAKRLLTGETGSLMVMSSK